MDTEYICPLAEPAAGTAAPDSAPESAEAYYRRRFAHATRDELTAEIIHLHRGYGTELADTERELCATLGWVEEPGYGYPTGDLTTPVLAMMLRGQVAVLHTDLSRRIAASVDAIGMPAVTTSKLADAIELAKALGLLTANVAATLPPAKAEHS